MYRRVMVGYVDSDEGRDAVALGSLIAQTTGAELILAGVFPHGLAVDLTSPTVKELLKEGEIRLAEKLKSAADAVRARAEPFPSSSRARGLHDALCELKADLVVVGSSSRAGLGRVLAGNVALQLLQGSPCAVGVAPRGFAGSEPSFSVIGVGIDGGQEATEALESALELGRAAGATLRLIAAADVASQSALAWGYGGEVAGLLREQFQSYLDRAADEVPDELVESTRLRDGGAAGALASEAEGVDLLCLGSRGYGPARRVLLGSESSKLVRDAPCALLLVPRSAHTTSD